MTYIYNTDIRKVAIEECHIKVEELDVDDFRDYLADPEKNFTRTKNMGFRDVLKVMFMKPGKSLDVALCEVHGSGKNRASVSAFIQRRDCLPPKFFEKLFDKMNAGYTPECLFKDEYAVFAVDGSAVNICPDANDKSTSLVLRDGSLNTQCNQIHLNAMMNVLDGHILDFVIQDYIDKDERGACAIMMEHLAAKQFENCTPLIVADRGYDGLNLMMLASSLGLKYCIRVKDVNSCASMVHRYACLKNDDGTIDCCITKKYTFNASKKVKDAVDFVVISKTSRNNFIPHNPFKQGMRYELKDVPYCEYTFRLVRFDLGDRNFETLLTNCSEDEFSVDDLKELYHMRWDIETSYRQLKYYDGIESSNTRKKEAAIGEIVMALIFHNICVSVAVKFEKKKSKTKDYYYKVSYSNLASQMRKYIAGRDPTVTPDNIIIELLRTMEAERKGRSYERTARKRSFKHFAYKAS